MLFLRGDGSVRTSAKISSIAGGFGGPIFDGDLLGSGLGTVRDLTGDGVQDLAVGAVHDDDGGSGPNADRGAAGCCSCREQARSLAIRR